MLTVLFIIVLFIIVSFILIVANTDGDVNKIDEGLFKDRIM